MVLDRRFVPARDEQNLIDLVSRSTPRATYCTMGLRATGSISLGCDLVAGSSLVPLPATGTIALRITS